jgi:hypothetical protein
LNLPKSWLWVSLLSDLWWITSGRHYVQKQMWDFRFSWWWVWRWQSVFWYIIQCSLVEADQRFRGAYCVHHLRGWPDDVGSTHLWNVGLLRDYTVLYPRRLWSSETNVSSFCWVFFCKQTAQTLATNWCGPLFPDSQDVDLDAILGELCALENQYDAALMAGTGGRNSSQHPGPKRTSVPNTGQELIHPISV